MPPGVPWAIHRVATSQRYTDSLHTIMSEWSLADVWRANEVLDAIAAGEAEAAKALREESDG